MRSLFFFTAITISTLLLSNAYADRANNGGEYVYYKLRDMEERLDSIESKLARINKKLQYLETHSLKNVQQERSIDSDDSEHLEIEFKSREQVVVADNNSTDKKSEPIKIDNNLMVGPDLKAAEREFYDDAFVALREKRVDRAEKLFLEFIKKFPESGLGSNAHYWLGEIYFSQSKYKDASYHFLQSYQLKPNGSKAPDSILKMGLSLVQLGNNSGACATLAKLHKDFPNAHQDIRRRANIELSKLRCDNS